MSQFRPSGFSLLPVVIKNLLIINGLMYLATVVAEQMNIPFTQYFALFFPTSPYFRPWQIITHVFMHGGFTHLLFNMFALWMFGGLLENVLGAKRFLIFYLVCGVGAALCFLAVQYFLLAPDMALFLAPQNINLLQNPINNPMVGASGAIFGLLFAFGYLFPNMMIYIYFLFPLKAKYFVAIYAALELWSSFANNPNDNVAHVAHLGGMLVAFILLKVWRIRYNNYG